MSNPYFYHAHIRKVLSRFIASFSNIAVIRTDENGNISQVINPVPIELGDRDTTVDILNNYKVEQEFISDTPITRFPRMSVDYGGMERDLEVQPNILHRRRYLTNYGKAVIVYRYVSVTMPITLNVFAFNKTEIDQIIGQIIPYFAPFQSLKIKNFPLENEDLDLILNLDGFGELQPIKNQTGRTYYYQALTFSVKFRMYGPAGTRAEDAWNNMLSSKKANNDHDYGNISDWIPDLNEDVTNDGMIKHIIFDYYTNINNFNNDVESDERQSTIVEPFTAKSPDDIEIIREIVETCPQRPRIE